MKAIFLDFDGVLINRESLRIASGFMARPDPPCIDALNYILEQTGASIVISSTWRLGYKNSIDDLRELANSWGIKGQVIGATPSYRQVRTSNRGQEIQAYLDLWGQDIQSFIIIDDDSDMEDLLPKLVKTKFEVGLTMADAERAIELLKHVE